MVALNRKYVPRVSILPPLSPRAKADEARADAPKAEARADLSLCEVRTTDAPTAGEQVALRLASTTESAPDPPCGREPPLLETCSVNQDTDVAGFNSYA